VRGDQGAVGIGGFPYALSVSATGAAHRRPGRSSLASFEAANLTRVASEMSYVCRRCGERHRGLPMSYGTDAPAYWDPSLAGDKSSTLEQEQCVIKDEHFFVRGRLVIPVTDAAGTEFDWGVWVSLSRDSFTRALSLRATPGRERERPYFGWMSTELPLYHPSTLSLKTRVHTRAVGQRPLIELEPTDHPLAVEQRTGITLARVQEIAETLLHALPAPLHAPDRYQARLSSVHADSGALRLGTVDMDLTSRHMVNRAMTRPFPPIGVPRECSPFLSWRIQNSPF
jgi:hypothetical protein